MGNMTPSNYIVWISISSISVFVGIIRQFDLLGDLVRLSVVDDVFFIGDIANCIC